MARAAVTATVHGRGLKYITAVRYRGTVHTSGQTIDQEESSQLPVIYSCTRHIVCRYLTSHIHLRAPN